jgi:predicted metal-dependent peptidase
VDSAEEMVRAARAKVAQVRPYFAQALFAHVLVEAPPDGALTTLAVDRHRRLYYNPTFVLGLTIEQLVTCLLHEVGHTLRCDHERARALGVTQATWQLANLAQDAAINDDLRQETRARKDIAPLPDFAVYPEAFDEPEDEPWEYYYHKLLAKALPMPCGHDCGSGAHGNERSWEHGDPAIPGSTEGVADADWDDVRRQTAQAIADHVRARGTVPAGWKEWADTLLRPRSVPWEQLLSAQLRWSLSDTAGMVLHSYKRPSRRASVLPRFCLPSMRAPRPLVAIVGDTSGSMSLEDLGIVRGVVEDVCLALGAHVLFLATDAAVHGGAQRVNGGRRVELAGRGGTNMTAGIEHALSLRPRPDTVLVVSDCETPWPARPLPRCKLVIAAVGNSPSIDKTPAWARTVRVDPSTRRAP